MITLVSGSQFGFNAVEQPGKTLDFTLVFDALLYVSILHPECNQVNRHIKMLPTIPGFFNLF